MLCDDLITIWGKCAKQARKDNETNEERRTKKRLVRFVITSAIIMIGMEIGFIYASSANNGTLLIALLVAAFVFTIVGVSVAYQLDERPEPKNRLSKRRTLYADALKKLLDEVELHESSVKQIKPLLDTWIKEKVAGRNSIINKIYSVCISGILVTAIASIVQHINDEPNSIALVLTLFICVASFAVAVVAGPIWELNDLRKSNSLDSALDLQNALNFNDVFESSPRDSSISKISKQSRLIIACNATDGGMD